MPAPYVPSAAAAAGRADFATIAEWVARGSHVLDLGCGDGSLLAYLARERGATGYGIEIDGAGVLACDRERHQRAAERPRVGARRIRRRIVRLRDPLADAAGDAAHRGHRRRDAPRRARSHRDVSELRALVAPVADRRGRMPVSTSLPYQWYDTPNIHLCTVADFDAFLAERRLPVMNRVVLAGGRPVGDAAQSPGRARDLPVPARVSAMHRSRSIRPRDPSPSALSNKLFWVGLLYFSEGYPLGVFYEIFPVYFRQQGVELRQIGVLSLLGLAWTLKFLWAPAIDYWRHHRRWMAAVDVAMGGAMLYFAMQVGFGPDGLARDRRVHRALGDERHRDRRLHDRVSRAGRARARQRDTDRPLSRRNARVRVRADGLGMARLARRVRAFGRRVLRAGGGLPHRAARAAAHDAARQRARRVRGARAIAVRACRRRGLRAGRAVAHRRHDEVVRAHRGVLGLRRRRRRARGRRSLP